jgi:hypothetical protein
VLRGQQHISNGPHFDYQTFVQNRNAVAILGDDSKFASRQDLGGATSVTKLHHQVEYLSLHGHIKASRRLVSDD